MLGTFEQRIMNQLLWLASNTRDALFVWLTSSPLDVRHTLLNGLLEGQ